MLFYICVMKYVQKRKIVILALFCISWFIYQDYPCVFAGADFNSSWYATVAFFIAVQFVSTNH